MPPFHDKGLLLHIKQKMYPDEVRKIHCRMQMFLNDFSKIIISRKAYLLSEDFTVGWLA